MQKKLLTVAVAAAFACSGCAGFTAYVHQHAAGIAAFTAVAGATATGESALINAFTLKTKVEAEIQEKK